MQNPLPALNRRNRPVRARLNAALVATCLVAAALSGTLASAPVMAQAAPGSLADIARSADQAYQEKRFDQALSLFGQAATLARSQGDSAAADSLLTRQRLSAGMLGNQMSQARKPAEALVAFQKALAISTERGREDDIQFDLAAVGWGFLKVRKYAEAERHYRRAIDLARKLNLPERELDGLSGLIMVTDESESIPVLVDSLQQQVALAERLKRPDIVVSGTRLLVEFWPEMKPAHEIGGIIAKASEAAKASKDPSDTLELTLAALEIGARMGMLGEVRGMLQNSLTESLLAPLPRGLSLRLKRKTLLAWIDDETGDREAALRGFSDVVRELAGMQGSNERNWTSTAMLIDARLELARHHLRAGQYNQSLQGCDTALGEAKKRDHWLSTGRSWLCKAQVYAELRKHSDADHAAGEAAKVGKAIGSKRLMAMALDAAGRGVAPLRYPGQRIAGNAADAERQRAQAGLSARKGAMDFFHEIGDFQSMARTAADSASQFLLMGHFEGAEALSGIGLEAADKLGDRVVEATARNIRAEMALMKNDAARVLEEGAQALALAEEAASIDNSVRAWDLLARSRQQAGQRAAAIFFRKQAVNTLQTLRSNSAGLSRDLRAAQTRAAENIYRELAADLMREGRLAEAEQVMALLKEEEFAAFLRQRGAQGAGALSLELTGLERQWQQRYGEVRDRVVKLGQAYRQVRPSALLTREQVNAMFGNLLAPDADQRARTLQAELAPARQAFGRYLGEASAAFASAPAIPASGKQGLLQSQLANMPAGAVAVYYLMLPGSLQILIATREGARHREVAISAAQLDEQVQTMRQLIQNPARDPRPLAQQLHQSLISPIEPELKAAQASTLMLALDGSLRYLPFAALHDGKQYLIEKLAITLYTAAARENIARKPRPAWTIAALGVSKAAPGFSALPGVPAELTGIVRDENNAKGVLPGKMLLDEGFTRPALSQALAAKPAVLHLASHFSFDANGTESDSYLLLGSGNTLSLADFTSGDFALDAVDLLTLSACQTGVGSTGRDGVEVEGFGVMAQRKGAAGVMATLWPVADGSTSLFMREFYRRKSASGDNKAQSMRHIQTGFIEGRFNAESLSQEARSARLSRPGNDSAGPGLAFTAPASAPFAHPFYWAPFILMGNWL